MNQIIVIAGPTASGKTALSIKLAAAFDSEIISADSRQFYRNMDIGTAKPSDEELNKIPHHLINSLDVTEKYNVGRFETEALVVAENLFRKLDTVFLTGGSGLYIDAFCKGMDDLPETKPEIREDLNKLFEKEGIEILKQKLQEADPEYFSECDINNPHRIMRALEIITITGEKYSTLRKKAYKKRDFKIKKIGLLVDRDLLYNRINKRVDRMIEQGLLKEVESLLPYRNEYALQTVGYRELFEFIDKKISFEEAVTLIKQNTRNYAKRQMTWFRKDPEMKWFETDETEKMITYIKK